MNSGLRKLVREGVYYFSHTIFLKHLVMYTYTYVLLDLSYQIAEPVQNRLRPMRRLNRAYVPKFSELVQRSARTRSV